MNYGPITSHNSCAVKKVKELLAEMGKCVFAFQVHGYHKGQRNFENQENL